MPRITGQFNKNIPDTKSDSEPIHRITNYSTNLSEQDWLSIHPLFPRVMLTSKNRKINLRDVVDAIAYWVENDISLTQLPEDFPRPGTVHYFSYRFAHDGTFHKFAEVLGHKHPLIAGIQKKMKSLGWINADKNDETKQHNQYVNK